MGPIDRVLVLGAIRKVSDPIERDEAYKQTRSAYYRSLTEGASILNNLMNTCFKIGYNMEKVKEMALVTDSELV